MKRVLSLLLLIVIGYSASTQLTIADYELNGSVKFCETFTSYPNDTIDNFGPGAANRNFDTYYQFNADGELIEEGVFDVEDDFVVANYDDSKGDSASFQLDITGMSVDEMSSFSTLPVRVMFQAFIDGAPNSVDLIYEFDKANKTLKEKIIEHDATAPVMVLVYHFNNQGRIVQFTGINDGGDEQQKILYKYDNNGNTLIRKSYRYGKLSAWSINEYDDSNMQIKEVRLKADSTQLSMRKWEFDAVGHEVRNTAISTEGKYEIISQYDQNGFVSSTTTTQANGSNTELIFEYVEVDEHSNWTKRRVCKNG